MSDDNKKAIEYFIEQMEQFGVACSTVSDGHVLLFKRKHMQKILDMYPDNDTLSIHIKRPDFKN